MNFHLDDPLAELLNDNSLENDNFFENPTIKPKKQPSVAKGKAKLDELFGIQEETETDFNSKRSNNPRITRQKPSQSIDDSGNDNDDDDLGFDPKKPKAAPGKTSILDDLLDTVKPKRPETAGPIMSRPPISRQSTDTTTDTSNLLTSQARPKTSVGRRSSTTSGAFNTDPLGLFGGVAGGVLKERETNVTTSTRSSPKMKPRGSTANWLGLAVDQDNVQRESVQPVTDSENMDTTLKTSTTTTTKLPLHEHNNEVVRDNTNPLQSTEAPQATDSTVQNIFLLSTLNAETKSTMATLQQQESQLTIAAQMKQQEQVLFEMQRKQELLLKQQEEQFQSLVKQQIQRQHVMEEQMKSQQQRINNHIQMLMLQPPIAASMSEGKDKKETVAEDNNESSHKVQETNVLAATIATVEFEADIKRLELEKLRLEELVENMKVNYEREIETIEKSYKKQIQVLEHHQEVLEQRLKLELEESKDVYETKLKNLDDEKQKLKLEYNTEITELKQNHEDELRKIRKSQEDDLEQVREEHRRMLENIREAKLLEFAAVQENGSYLATLSAASNNLQQLSGGLEGLRDNMELKIESINKEKERILESRERRLEDAERRLEITQESVEEEKHRLMALVTSLELQLSQLSRESVQENWLLRQKMATLEAEKVAFEREKQYAREAFQADEKRVADLKEQQLLEGKKFMLQLQEERERLHVERAKIETERKLHPQPDLEKQQLEVEAALKVAHDAARQSDAERSRYNQQIRLLEQRQRALNEKENDLDAKEMELDQKMDSLRLTERKMQEAQKRTQSLEQNLAHKVQLMQQYMRELSQKEATITEERMLLSNERLTLQSLQKRLADRKCVLCKMAEKKEQITQLLNGGGIITEFEGSSADVIHNNLQLSPLPVSTFNGNDLVDRMLDDNIAKSLSKMNAFKTGLPDMWRESMRFETTIRDLPSGVDINNVLPNDDLHLNNKNA